MRKVSEMAVAYFRAHAPQGFGALVHRGEAALLSCFLLLFVAASGAGAWRPRRNRASAHADRGRAGF